jgi:precorrin-2 dehydrogenase/sirohydrochlorin ferrochelatase
MSYLVNLIVEGRAAVVVGGGAVAARKVEDLLAAGAGVTVVAPRLCGRIVSLAAEGRIQARSRPYTGEDLAGAFLAIAATDDEAVNARVARDAAAMNVLVNVVDCPALCSFTVPATVSRGHLALAVATEGRCPALAGILRRELETRYGPEYAELVNLFAALRQEMMAQHWDGRRIREALAEAYRDGVIGLIAAGENEALRDFLRSRLGPGFPLPQ